MGRSIFQIDKLGEPLDRVVERVMFIPRGRRLVVNNVQQKIVIFLEGSVRALVNGRVVGEMKEGDALVIPGACRQAYIPLAVRREMRMHVLILVFTRGIFACDKSLLRALPVTRADAEQTPENFIRRHFGSVQRRCGVLTPAANASIAALRHEAAEKGVGHRLRAVAHALLLLTEIARRESAPTAVPAERMSRQAWIVEQAKNFLLEHHAEELTLEQVAWHVRLSGEHLARTFRGETGQTIFGYLQHLRMERAKTQLASSQLKVCEIARLAGFGTASQLCRTFKRATGESPVAYRLRMARDTAFSPSKLEGIVV